MTTLPAFLALLGLWFGLGLFVGVCIGRGSRIADDAEHTDEDYLADQPTEILAQSEIDARFDAMTSRQREWYA